MSTPKTKLTGVGGDFTLPKVATIFLVVEYSVNFKGSPQDESKFAFYGTAITEEGETLTPAAFGFSLGDTFYYGTVEEGSAMTLESQDASDSQWNSSLAFIIPEDTAEQVHKIQFISLPDVTFTVEAKP